MKIGFIVSRASALTPTWTTLHLAGIALKRGHSVRIIEPADFELKDASLSYRAHCFDPPECDPEHLSQALIDRRAPRRIGPIEQLDVLFFRHAPLLPEVLTFGRIAEARGVRVINSPSGMLTVSDKTWFASLHDVPMPPTLVTQRSGAAHHFYSRQRHGVVIKPPRGSAGNAIEIVAPNAPSLLDAAIKRSMGNRGGYRVIQAYLSQADQGEKRVVWYNGRVLGAYLRTRAEGTLLHNLKRGGTASATTLTKPERVAISRLSPHLLGEGIQLAGIDLIGQLITEVNVLNPGGAYHLDRLCSARSGEHIIKQLEATHSEPT